MKNRIPVFFSCNDEYAAYLATAMASILASAAPEDHISFFILSQDLTSDTTRRLGLLADIRPFHMEVLKPDRSLMSKVPKPPHDHITVEANFRMLIASAKPQIQKAVYLDSDLVVVKSLGDLWNTDISDCYAAAVPGCGTDQSEAWVREDLELPREFPYFNSGVMLLNLKKWREDDIEAKLFANNEKYLGKCKFPDQDLLNLTLHPHVKMLGHTWNAVPIQRYGDITARQEAMDDPHILHWAGTRKPWVAPRVPYADVFWKYARMTPFFEDILLQNMMSGNRYKSILDRIITAMDAGRPGHQ